MSLLIRLVLLVPCTLLRGVVVRDLWAWFITPFGLPHLGLAQAIGISIFVALLTMQPTTTPFDKIENEAVKALTETACGVFVNLAVWGIAACVASFM